MVHTKISQKKLRTFQGHLTLFQGLFPPCTWIILFSFVNQGCPRIKEISQMFASNSSICIVLTCALCFSCENLQHFYHGRKINCTIEQLSVYVPVTWGNFLCNLQCNAIVKQVAEEIACKTPCLCNMQCNENTCMWSKLLKKLNNLLFAMLGSL